MTKQIISSLNYDDDVCVLVDCDGVPVVFGSTVESSKGESWTVDGGRAPHKPSSTGRISVSLVGSNDPMDAGREFFPSVFGCNWVVVECEHGFAMPGVCEQCKAAERFISALDDDAGFIDSGLMAYFATVFFWTWCSFNVFMHWS